MCEGVVRGGFGLGGERAVDQIPLSGGGGLSKSGQTDCISLKGRF
jgi:hypothetical protein